MTYMTLKLFIPVQWDEINFEEAITWANQAEIFATDMFKYNKR